MSDTSHSVYFHGVFMEIFGKGILLKGQSGIGKSETALALIDRGSQLVADDIVVFCLSSCGEKVSGSCPKELKDLLEVRGLGILNIRRLFSQKVLKNESFLDLILQLVPFSQEKLKPMDRLRPIYAEEKILGLSIPAITLHVQSGRNTALLVETAVRYSTEIDSSVWSTS